MKQLILPFLLTSSAAAAIEDARVLPQGVRRLMLTSVHSEFGERTNEDKQPVGLASKLERDVAFEDFLKVRSGFDRVQLEAFMLAYGVDPKDTVGAIKADLKGAVDVFAPSFTYGVSERLSVGLVVPVYHAHTSVSAAFQPNANADRFLSLLADPKVGQAAKLREATNSVNGVMGLLQDKLLANGYQPLEDWQATGIGDMFVKAKYQALTTERGRIAGVWGVAAPTGRIDDPDILTDIGFGDGTWDVFLGAAFDETVWGPLFFNQYVQYTAQLPARRPIRMKTEDEPIAVDKADVRYKLGDKIDASCSAQVDTHSGWQSGLGYAFYHKFEDHYQADTSSELYEANTEETSHMGEAFVGYSSVNAYRAGRSLVPAAANVTYNRQLQSRNAVVGDKIQVDFKLYF